MLSSERRTKNETCRYIMVNDWLAGRRDLTSTEKLIIAHIMGFGAAGCWKSSTEFSRYLGIRRATFIEAYLSLARRRWIAVLPDAKRQRVLFINDEMLDNMPLLDCQKGCNKPVTGPVKNPSEPGKKAGTETAPALVRKPHHLVRKPYHPSAETALALYRREYTLLDPREERLETLVGCASEVLRGKKTVTHLSDEELNRRRQQQIKALGISRE